MAQLIYSAITSLDGYVADQDGNFDWLAPDPELHAFVNDLERSIGTYLYGRKMYEVMAAWQHPESFGDQSSVTQDFAAIWQAADKIVFSRTLKTTTTERTTISSDFDPDLVQRIKSSTAHDMSVGGAELAGEAIRAGLVDEYHLFVVPVVLGGGTRCLPNGVRLRLQLVDYGRFSSGVVYLHYQLD